MRKSWIEIEEPHDLNAWQASLRKPPPAMTLKFLNLLISLRSWPPLSSLNGDEERILFARYATWQERREFWVSDVYALGGEKSASFAYRHLMNLKKKGLVDITIDNEDKRRRSVTFTKAAERLFAALQ